MRKAHFIIIISVMLLFIAGQVYANMTIPNTFTGGTPAVAGEVNENFATVEESMPGIEYVINQGNVSATNSMAVISSIELTAPVAGYVFIAAFGNGECDDADSHILLDIENETTAATNGTRSNYTGGVANNWYYYSINATHTVIAGTNKLNLNGRCSGGDGQIQVENFSAIFIPNRY